MLLAAHFAQDLANLEQKPDWKIADAASSLSGRSKSESRNGSRGSNLNSSSYAWRNRRSEHTVRILIAIAAVALLLRLMPLLQPGAGWTLGNDSARYVELASGLRAGCGFARLDGGVCGPPETLRTPGYPLFLAAFSKPRIVVAAQAVLGAATCLLVGYFTATRWGFAAGAAAEIFLALDIPSIVSGAMVMSDTLFQLLLTLGILLEMLAIDANYPRLRRLCLVTVAGLSLGAAILVRPIGILLPFLALLPFVASTPSRLKAQLHLAVIIIFIPAAVGVGWAARNYYRTGMWTLSTISAYNLYFFRAGGVIWFSEGGDFRQIQKTLERNLDLAPSQSPRNIDAQMDHLMVARSLKIISAHPFQFIRMSLISLLWLAIVPDRANLLTVMSTHDASIPFTPAGALANRIKTALRSPTITALLSFQLASILVIWIGVARALLSPGARRGELIVLVFIALTMLALASGSEAQARLRTPAIPFLAIAAGAGWFRTGQARRPFEAS